MHGISPGQVFEPCVKADVDVHLYIRCENVNVVKPQEGIHKGPDAASFDFAIWEILIRRFQKQRKSTI